MTKNASRVKAEEINTLQIVIDDKPLTREELDQENLVCLTRDGVFHRAMPWTALIRKAEPNQREVVAVRKMVMLEVETPDSQNGAEKIVIVDQAMSEGELKNTLSIVCRTRDGVFHSVMPLLVSDTFKAGPNQSEVSVIKKSIMLEVPE